MNSTEVYLGPVKHLVRLFFASIVDNFSLLIIFRTVISWQGPESSVHYTVCIILPIFCIPILGRHIWHTGQYNERHFLLSKWLKELMMVYRILPTSKILLFFTKSKSFKPTRHCVQQLWPTYPWKVFSFLFGICTFSKFNPALTLQFLIISVIIVIDPGTFRCIFLRN